MLLHFTLCRSFYRFGTAASVLLYHFPAKRLRGLFHRNDGAAPQHNIPLIQHHGLAGGRGTLGLVKFQPKTALRGENGGRLFHLMVPGAGGYPQRLRQPRNADPVDLVRIDDAVKQGILRADCDGVGLVIRAYDHRILNIHPSLIPSFCGDGFYGLHVHEAALKRGVKVTGATVHFVNEITDGGDIIAQKAVEVLPGDTPETLQRRVMEQAEWILLPQALEQVAGEIAKKREEKQ